MSNTIITILKENYWDSEVINNTYNIKHCENGYETHIPYDIQKIIKKDYSNTGLFIRFSPDFILTQHTSKIINSILLEYKVTATPRFTLKDNQWYYGQVEADALDNYINITKIGVKVAILIYCPYHPRPLICEYANKVNRSRRHSIRNGFGSNTDYYNIDLNCFRNFHEFMEDEFNVPISVTKSQLSNDFYCILKTNPKLSIKHHPKSQYKIETGSNWIV